MLRLRGVSRSFREGGRTRRVLQAVDFDVEAGRYVAIMGRSGSGKSTLLNLMAGIDRPDAGSIALAGCDIGTLAEPARTRLRRANVGFVYQFFNLLGTLSVEENVRIQLELNGVRGAPARRRSAALLGEVGLGDRLESSIDALSGGEQQRVAIARALVHEPQLVLADEPTGNLDEATAREIVPMLRTLASARGAALVMVTHDAALAAGADQIVELFEGRLRARP